MPVMLVSNEQGRHQPLVHVHQNQASQNHGVKTYLDIHVASFKNLAM